MIKSAVISRCGLYRYELVRKWGEGETCVFIGLNPSTADEVEDDPTIRRCIGFARTWGYERLVMINAYAYRSTDPKQLQKVSDPIGKLNDKYLRYWGMRSEMVIAAWGTLIHPDRQEEIKEMIHTLYYLKMTKEGFPSHPLYLSSNLEPRLFSLS